MSSVSYFSVLFTSHSNHCDSNAVICNAKMSYLSPVTQNPVMKCPMQKVLNGKISDADVA